MLTCVCARTNNIMASNLTPPKGNSKCEATTSTTATTTTATSTTTTPSPWKLVYRQKKCGNDGTDQGSEGDDCYAKLSDIANYKVDGRFTFKMVYPGEWYVP